MIFERNSFAMKRTAGATAVLFIFSTLSAPLVEANFWSDRRQNAQRTRSDSDPVLLAKAPLGANASADILSQMPAASRPLSLSQAPAAPAAVLAQLQSRRNPAVTELVRALPADVGGVRQVFLPAGAAPKTVVHIQDVHLNDEAQRNIGAAIRTLLDGKNIGVVALEGAFHDLELSRPRAFPYKAVTEGIADYLRREGKISGAVYTGLTSENVVPFTGVDDKVRYDANVNAYLRSVKSQPGVIARLQNETRALESRKAAAFNPGLREFDKQVQAYHAESLPLTRYARFLASHAEVGAQVKLLVQAAEMESALDFAQVEADRRRLVEALARRLDKAELTQLMETGVAYRLGQISHGHFYGALQALCAQKDLDLAKFPSMDGYVRYVLVSDRINAGALFSEILAAENRGYTALSRTAAEKSLVAQSRQAALALKLVNFSLTPEEWHQYAAGRAADPALVSFEDFYREAEARNDAIVGKLLAAMDRRGTRAAVLVTGGFHAPGVESRLAKANVAVVSYIPKITKVDLKNGAAYLSVFAQEKTPLEQLFQGRKLFTAPEVYTPAVRREILAAQPPAADAAGLSKSPGVSPSGPGRARRMWTALGRRFNTEVAAHAEGAKVIIKEIRTSPAAVPAIVLGMSALGAGLAFLSGGNMPLWAWAGGLGALFLAAREYAQRQFSPEPALLFGRYAVPSRWRFAWHLSTYMVVGGIGLGLAIYAVLSAAPLAGVTGAAVVGAFKLRPDVAGFADLFGDHELPGPKGPVKVNGLDLIERLQRKLGVDIEANLDARRERLASKAPVRQKFGWPAWTREFTDADGNVRSFRDISQGLIDNFQGKATPLAWRLNDSVSLPKDADPILNPGLELTGPWYPEDFPPKQIEADVAAMMGVDEEDASAGWFRPAGVPTTSPIPVYSQRRNTKDVLAGLWKGKVITKNGKAYEIKKDRDDWPTHFHRSPSQHLFDPTVTDAKGTPARAIIVSHVVHFLNNYGALKRGRDNGAYYYEAKIQTAAEALVVEKLLRELEQTAGLPKGSIKIAVLYEEAQAGLELPAILWTLRERVVKVSVGRWDYWGSLEEMWARERAFPDARDPNVSGMASGNMVAYQDYAVMILFMAGLKDGAQTNGALIGGMSAAMLYPDKDPRSVYNPIALRMIEFDKLRERAMGLVFVPSTPLAEGQRPTLQEILDGKVQGRLYDTVRQSWVASPDAAYVAAGKKPLVTPVEDLQADLIGDVAGVKTVDVRGNAVPAVNSPLSERERQTLRRIGILNDQDQITPKVFAPEAISRPEQIFTQARWDAIYGVPAGPRTVERLQLEFFMAANYAFQILNGNYAAAIDDYDLKLRFMNDLATYRGDHTDIWSALHNKARTTAAGFLKEPAFVPSEGAVNPSVNGEAIPAGTVFDQALFLKIWNLQNRWTEMFFAEQDKAVARAILQRHGVGSPNDQRVSAIADSLGDFYAGKSDISQTVEEVELLLGAAPADIESLIESGRPRFDRAKAPIVMDILKRQMLSPRYIQHSARVLFVVAEAPEAERENLLEAIFSPSREAVVEKVRRGALTEAALAAHDYVYDYYPNARTAAAAAAAPADPGAFDLQRNLQPLLSGVLDSIERLENKAQAEQLFIDAVVGPRLSGEFLQSRLLALGAEKVPVERLVAFYAGALGAPRGHEAFQTALFNSLIAINDAVLGNPAGTAGGKPPTRGSVLAVFTMMAADRHRAFTLEEIAQRLGRAKSTIEKDATDLRRLSPAGLPLLISRREGNRTVFQINPAVAIHAAAIVAQLEAHYPGARDNARNDLAAAAQGIAGLLAPVQTPAAPLTPRGDWVIPFRKLGRHDVPKAGGKNSSLGEMIDVAANLEIVPRGMSVVVNGRPFTADIPPVKIPDGNAVTTDAYQDYLAAGADLRPEMKEILDNLDTDNQDDLNRAADRLKRMIMDRPIPAAMGAEIIKAFRALKLNRVAVRSSATAEDKDLTEEEKAFLGEGLTSGSSAGQQSTLLNKGEDELIDAVQECFASLFNANAISYRDRQGYIDFILKLRGSDRLPAFLDALRAANDPHAAEIAEMIDSKKNPSRRATIAAIDQVKDEAFRAELRRLLDASYAPYIDPSVLSLSVGIQHMIKADSAAVIFSHANGWTGASFQRENLDRPTEGRVMTIQLVNGLGEGVVGGGITPASYEVHVFQRRGTDGRERLHANILSKTAGTRAGKFVYVDDTVAALGLTVEEARLLFRRLQGGVGRAEDDRIGAILAKLGIAEADTEKFFHELYALAGQRVSDLAAAEDRGALPTAAVPSGLSQKQFVSLAMVMAEWRERPTSRTFCDVSTPKERDTFPAPDETVINMALQAAALTNHFGRVSDMELAVDQDGQIYFLQSRSITTKTEADDPGKLRITNRVVPEDVRNDPATVVVAQGDKTEQASVGRVFYIDRHRPLDDQFGAFFAAAAKDPTQLVSQETTPDYEPVLKKSVGAVTDSGGRTSHAAIVAKELGIPSVPGFEQNPDKLDADYVKTNGNWITVDGNNGLVYKGQLPIEVQELRIDPAELPDTQRTKPALIVANPQSTQKISPIAFYAKHGGITLARAEFILASIGIHLRALLAHSFRGRANLTVAEQDMVTRLEKDPATIAKIDQKVKGWSDARRFGVDKITEGMSAFAASQALDQEVLWRFNDFKQNEMLEVIGGRIFGKREDATMIGNRGTGFLLDNVDLFEMELEAAAATYERGYTNFGVFLPFVRTPQELKVALEIMHRRNFPVKKIGIMVELPSNVVQIKGFLALLAEYAKDHPGTEPFISFGTNDLTQLTLRAGREEAQVRHLFDEGDPTLLASLNYVTTAVDEVNAEYGIEIKKKLCGEIVNNLSKVPDSADPAVLEKARLRREFAKAVLRLLDSTGVGMMSYMRVLRMILETELEDGTLAKDAAPALVGTPGQGAHGIAQRGTGARRTVVVENMEDLLKAGFGSFVAISDEFFSKPLVFPAGHTDALVQAAIRVSMESFDANLIKWAEKVKKNAGKLPAEDLALFYLSAVMDRAGGFVMSEETYEKAVLQYGPAAEKPVVIVPGAAMDRLKQLVADEKAGGPFTTINFGNGAIHAGHLPIRLGNTSTVKFPKIEVPSAPVDVPRAKAGILNAGEVYRQQLAGAHPAQAGAPALKAAVKRAMREKIREAIANRDNGNPPLVIFQTSDLTSAEYQALKNAPNEENAEPNPPLGNSGVTRMLKDRLYLNVLYVETEALAELSNEYQGRVDVGLSYTDVRQPEQLRLVQERVFAHLASRGLSHHLKVGLRMDNPVNYLRPQDHVEGEKGRLDFVVVNPEILTQFYLAADRHNENVPVNNDPDRFEDSKYPYWMVQQGLLASQAGGAVPLIIEGQEPAAWRGESTPRSEKARINEWAVATAPALLDVWERDAIPGGGESLAVFTERVGDFYEEDIRDRDLKNGKKSLVAASGNVIGALLATAIGRKDKVPPHNLIPTATPILVWVNRQGISTHLEILARDHNEMTETERRELAALQAFLKNEEVPYNLRRGIEGAGHAPRQVQGEGVLVLVRSAASDVSLRRANIPLTQKGQRDAALAGQFVRAKLGEGVVIDQAYSSDQGRAMTTAAAVAKPKNDGQAPEVQTRDALMPRGAGILARISPDDQPKSVAEILRRAAAKNPDLVGQPLPLITRWLREESMTLDLSDLPRSAPLMVRWVENAMVALVDRLQARFPGMGFPVRTVAALTALAELVYLPVMLFSPRYFARSLHDSGNTAEAQARWQDATVLGGATWVAMAAGLFFGAAIVDPGQSGPALFLIGALAGAVVNAVLHAYIDFHAIRRIQRAATQEAREVVGLLENPAAGRALLPGAQPLGLEELAGPRQGPLYSKFLAEALARELAARGQTPSAAALTDSLVQRASVWRETKSDDRAPLFVALIKTSQDVEALAQKVAAESSRATVLPVLVGEEGEKAWAAQFAKVSAAAVSRGHRVTKPKPIAIGAALDAADLASLLSEWGRQAPDAARLLRESRLLLAVSRGIQWLPGSFDGLAANDPLRDAEVFILGLYMPNPVKLMEVLELDALARKVIAQMA